MMQIVFKHPEFMVPILILLSFSIICQVSMGVLCHKLIWESENMSSTANKSLQQLKLKFSSCCQLHEGMSNIAVFVDKYMNQLKICGFSLSVLKHLSGQLVLLSILISGIGACRGIIAGESILYIVPYYIISFLGLYCYFAISSLVDIVGKTQILRTNLIDYLENHLVNRLEQTTLDLKLVQGEERVQEKESAQTETNVQAAEEMPETTQKASERPEDSVLSRTEAKELESLLREFLV
ncbi:MAG: hypothetical protein HFI52_09075 [Lachnospiraceae bacterium]|nr:hypothetical protein [Lachnospiraceae bacterium]